jgi:hypothetical protein
MNIKYYQYQKEVFLTYYRSQVSESLVYNYSTHFYFRIYKWKIRNLIHHCSKSCSCSRPFALENYYKAKRFSLIYQSRLELTLPFIPSSTASSPNTAQTVKFWLFS